MNRWQKFRAQRAEKYAAEGWKTKRQQQQEQKRRERDDRRRLAMPTLAAMIAETPPGCCIGCDEKLPASKPKKTILCGSLDCRALYLFVYKLDERSRKRAKGLMGPPRNVSAPVPDLVTFVFGRRGQPARVAA